MGSNDNRYDDGAAPLRATAEQEQQELSSCDDCGALAPIGQHTFMRHGFNGIKEGDADDINKLLCEECLTRHDNKARQL